MSLRIQGFYFNLFKSNLYMYSNEHIFNIGILLLEIHPSKIIIDILKYLKIIIFKTFENIKVKDWLNKYNSLYTLYNFTELF